MTESTQADRDAAAEAFFCKPLLNEKYNDDRRVRAFARHRQQAIEQLEREKAVVYDLWEQQKEIALDYLADCNKAADRIEALRLAVVHYDAALKSSWPYGAKGDAWEHWNEARITLQEVGETFTRSSDT
jgi:hypothetical protein